MDSRVALKCRARFTSNSLSSVCKARLPRWQDALDAGPLRDSKRLEETPFCLFFRVLFAVDAFFKQPFSNLNGRRLGLPPSDAWVEEALQCLSVSFLESFAYSSRGNVWQLWAHDEVSWSPRSQMKVQTKKQVQNNFKTISKQFQKDFKRKIWSWHVTWSSVQRLSMCLHTSH